MKSKRRQRKIVFPTVLAALFTAFPAVGAAAQPNSGSVIESVKPPAIYQAPATTPVIRVEEKQPEIPKDGGTVTVKGVRFSGELPLPEQALQQQIQSEIGKEMTLADLNNVAAKITQYLRQQGYLIGFAYIPEQTIHDNTVEIAVVPGRYGKLKIINNGRLNMERAKDLFSLVTEGGLILRAPLERVLLLTEDLAGVNVKATLSPGEASGTADLIVEMVDGEKMSGAIYVDNWGNRYTGQMRYGTQLTLNNVTQRGDSFSIGGVTTAQGINNYNFGYMMPLGNDGLKLDMKYSHVGYTLGDSFAALGATGRATIAGYSLTYPLIRSRAFTLHGTVGYERKHLQDDIASYASFLPRNTSGWNLGLSGTFSDDCWGGAINEFSTTYYHGNMAFSDATAAANDSATAQSAGTFSKMMLNFKRQQYLAQNLSLYLSVSGQLADKNLDSSEKLYLGGADGVRAFPQGEASGDEGYKLTGEIRWRVPGLSDVRNNVSIAGFYDCGSVMINKRPYSSDANRRSLEGAGLGILWTREKEFAVRLDYAWKLGADQATADKDRSGRLWLQAIKYL